MQTLILKGKAAYFGTRPNLRKAIMRQTGTFENIFFSEWCKCTIKNQNARGFRGIFRGKDRFVLRFVFSNGNRLALVRFFSDGSGSFASDDYRCTPAGGIGFAVLRILPVFPSFSGNIGGGETVRKMSWRKPEDEDRIPVKNGFPE